MGDMKNVNAQKNNLFRTFVFPPFVNTQMKGMNDKKPIRELNAALQTLLHKFFFFFGENLISFLNLLAV